MSRIFGDLQALTQIVLQATDALPVQVMGELIKMPSIRHYASTKPIRRRMKMIELVQVSEMTHDCSAKFYVYMPILYSVSVLILEILSKYRKDWGYIKLYDDRDREKPTLAWEYSRGLVKSDVSKDLDRLDFDIRRCKVLAAEAVGGYYNMNYKIYYKRRKDSWIGYGGRT